MREIVFDTETTGLDPREGHRVVEIGCVELVNHLPTGNDKQWYINPERDMPEEAYRIHGLSEEFLKEHPVFADISGDFLAYIGEARLVAHNAMFDLKFINAELIAVGAPKIAPERMIDTIPLARQKIPGAQYSLDALCRRFDIDLERREKHGALLDSELLAEVYLELIGGRQPGLTLVSDNSAAGPAAAGTREPREARPHAATPAELEAHKAFVEKLTDPIWLSDDK
jgi:DNA polymerase-3 subunit epsilon